jgi:hypothetical protein
MVSESKDSNALAKDAAEADQETDGGNSKTPDSTKQGQQRRRDRGNRSNNNINNSFKKPTPHHSVKFEGRCAEVKGEIYDCSDVRQVDGYTKTT